MPEFIETDAELMLTLEEQAVGSIANNLTTTVEGYALDARQGYALDNKKLDNSKVANNLTTIEAGLALDARQGKWLDENKLGFSDIVNNLETDDVKKVLSAAQGKALAGRTAPNSEKLGGKPPEFYLTPRNLLNNSYFINPVNQREYSSGSVVKPWGYFIDRWINNSDQNATYTLSERGLGIRANNTITQKIPDISAGTVVSFSATDDNGNTIVISGTVAYNADGSWLQMAVDEENSSFGVMLATSGGFVQVVIAAKTNVTISVAALYGGAYTVSSLPPYYPNDYSFELENCKKYFEKVKCAGVLSKTDYLKNYVCAPVNFTEKRIVPTVIVESLWCPKYYSMEQLGTIDIRETDRKSVILSSATLTAEGCLFHATLHVSGDL